MPEGKYDTSESRPIHVLPLANETTPGVEAAVRSGVEGLKQADDRLLESKIGHKVIEKIHTTHPGGPPGVLTAARLGGRLAYTAVKAVLQRQGIHLP